MNPDTAIRPWLLAVGKYFGINEALDHRLADPSTRPREPYFTYRIIRMRPQGKRVIKDDSVSPEDATTAIIRGIKEYSTTVRIEVFRELNGMQILGKCVIAAEIHPAIKQHFSKSSCAFQQQDEDIEDLTPDEATIVDGDLTEHYRHRMDAIFNDNVEMTFVEPDCVVQTVEIDLGLF